MRLLVLGPGGSIIKTINTTKIDYGVFLLTSTVSESEIVSLEAYKVEVQTVNTAWVWTSVYS